MCRLTQSFRFCCRLKYGIQYQDFVLSPFTSILQEWQVLNLVRMATLLSVLHSMVLAERSTWIGKEGFISSSFISILKSTHQNYLNFCLNSFIFVDLFKEQCLECKIEGDHETRYMMLSIFISCQGNLRFKFKVFSKSGFQDSFSPLPPR